MVGIDYIGGRPGNYVLGRGKLYLQGEQSLYPLGWRDAGNCSAFTITQESEKKEHQSFLAGIKTIDLEVPVSSKVSLAITLDETANILNLAAAFLGTAHGFSTNPLTIPNLDTMLNAAACASDDVTSWSPSGPMTAGTSGTVNFYMAGGTVRTNMWYDLYLTMRAITGVFTGGDIRAYNFDSTQTITVRSGVTDRTATASGSLLVEGTHYTLDREMGRIKIIDAAFAFTTTNLLVFWTAPAVNRHMATYGVQGQDMSLEHIKPLVTSGLTVALKFVQVNPNDAAALPLEYEFFKVKLSPDGDVAMIGDDWATLAFTGVAATIPNPPPYASAYGRITGRTVKLS